VSDGPVEEVPPGFETVMSTGPAAPAGARASSEVGVTAVTAVEGVAPNETVASAVNPVPVTVTTVPPESGPATGTTPVTAGTAS